MSYYLSYRNAATSFAAKRLSWIAGRFTIDFIEVLITSQPNRKTITMTSDMLKEAIADAKAIRATALANAKIALEEAFAPRFHAMFADKLKEEAEEQQEAAEPVAEVEAPHNVSKAVSTKDVSKGQPKKMHSGKDFKPVQAGEGPDGVGKLHQPVCETEEVPVDENVEEAGLTSEDLDEIIAELEAEVADDAEGEVAAPAPEVPMGGEVPPMAPPVADAGCPCAAPAAPMVPPVAPAPMAAAPAPVGGDVPPVGEPDGDEEINLEELIASLNEADDEVTEGKLPPWLKKDKKDDDKDEKKDDDDDEKKIDESSKEHGMPAPDKGQAKDKDALKKAPVGSKNSGGDIEGTHKMHEVETLKVENAELKVALKEHSDTVEFLQGQINEVNLLNAKLLYTNKLFKEYAGSLDRDMRMKIVEHFDLTKTVREVKLAYAVLAESLSFGVKAAKPADKKPVVKAPAQVKQITEGLASKPVASTAPPKEILSEGADMASRFKKLAGIKTQPPKK